MISLDKELNYGQIIKDKRQHIFNMSQEDFAAYFEVPVGTLRNWEQNLSQPPEHFMKLLKISEDAILEQYAPPIYKHRKELLQKSTPEQNAIRRNARIKIKNDDKQSIVHDILMKMTDPDGILENLQAISPYFNDYNTTDIAAIYQLVLLKNISDKLDILINDKQ